ncbi:MAG TPA: hypothetical protein RMH99_11655, partial [Sandaracinaceae bacterium LLY-WYZ-13_1]|nr:hypothetical protein [Sandaracinaceae bacterium LLY-WYZ-13_1]
MVSLLDGVAIDGEPAIRVGDEIRVAGRRVGRLHPEQRRIAWEHRVDPTLAERARVERGLFDVRSLVAAQRA